MRGEVYIRVLVDSLPWRVMIQESHCIALLLDNSVHISPVVCCSC